MTYSLRHIHYFVAVAEELHFRRAAERLHVAQPALSRAIQILEERVGARLLRRNNRRVELTTAGRLFLDGSRQAIRALETAATRARRGEAGEIGHLVIGYTDFAISGRLPAILEQLHRRFPELSVDLVRMDSHKQISALTGQRLDLGFLTGPISYQDMKVLTVQEERFVVVFPEDHPLAALAEVPVAALANEPFVLGDPQFWRHFIPQIHALCAAAGFVPRVSVEGINSDGIFGLVAARMGVTIYPECVRNYRRTGLAIRPLQDVQTRLCTEVAWISSNPNPAIDQLISTIRELDSIRS